MREPLEPRRAQDTAGRSGLPLTSNSPAEATPPDSRIEEYLDRIFGPLAGLIPPTRCQELRTELALHLDALAEAHRELGSEAEEAVRAAMKQLGDPRHLARDFAEEWRCPTGPALSAAKMVPCALVFGMVACFGTLGLTVAIRQVGGDWRIPLGGPGLPLVAGFLVGLWHGRHPLGSRWGLLAIGLMSLMVSAHIPGGEEFVGQSFRAVHLLMSLGVGCGMAGLGTLIRMCEDRRQRSVPE
jgi:hypothetical protein